MLTRRAGCQVLKDRYLLSSESKAYMIPPDSVDFNDYKGFIKALPVREVPSVFSMHNNADISYQVPCSGAPTPCHPLPCTASSPKLAAWQQPHTHSCSR